MKRRWRDICLELIYCSEVTKQQPYLSISISRSNKRSGMQTIVIQHPSQDDPIINQTLQVFQWLYTSSDRHALWDRPGTWSDSIFSLVSRRLVYKDKDRFTSTTKTHWTATDLQMQPIATSPPSTSSSIHMKQPRHSFHQTLSNATQQTYQQLWDPDHCYKQGKGTPTSERECRPSPTTVVAEFFFLRSILRNWARKQEDTIPSFELPHKYMPMKTAHAGLVCARLSIRDH